MRTKNTQSSAANRANHGVAPTAEHPVPSGARQAPLPEWVAPMLANTGSHSFPGSGWIYEPKLDGIRAVVVARGGEIEMLSRRGLLLTPQYPHLAKELAAAVKGDCILDGEIVALDERGVPSFQQLQQRMNLCDLHDIKRAEKHTPVVFFAFDVIHVESMSLLRVPLRQRKLLLPDTFDPSATVQCISYWEGKGAAVYEACLNLGFEGVVAKRAESLYEPGRRSDNWIKLKPHQTAEFVVGGYTRGNGGRNGTFGALMLGRYNADGQLIYAGSVGTGFSDALLARIFRLVAPLQNRTCPFEPRPTDKPNPVWLSPQIVAEVKFMTFTNDGKLRAPVFLRFRDDLHHLDIRL